VLAANVLTASVSKPLKHGLHGFFQRGATVAERGCGYRCTFFFFLNAHRNNFTRHFSFVGRMIMALTELVFCKITRTNGKYCRATEYQIIIPIIVVLREISRVPLLIVSVRKQNSNVLIVAVYCKS